jgi:hypothetical protein
MHTSLSLFHLLELLPQPMVTTNPPAITVNLLKTLAIPITITVVHPMAMIHMVIISVLLLHVLLFLHHHQLVAFRLLLALK